MKRTKIIMAFLLCACLIVGVGYAALSDVMDVTGTTTYNEDKALDALVYFVEPGKSNDENNVQIVSGNTDKVSFNINSLASVGNYTYFWVKVHNDSEKTVNIDFKEYSANTDGQTYYTFLYYMGDVSDLTAETYHNLDLLSFVELDKAGETKSTNPEKHDTLEIPRNSYKYLCVKVLLSGDSGVMGSGTISATFNFEIEATTAD